MFAPDPDILLPGDIILSREKGKVSTTIQVLTLGRYSHAAIYLGAYSYAEAAGPDTLVAAENIQRLMFENPTDCCVLRLKQEITPNERDNIVMGARQLIGQRYSLEEAKKVLSYLFNEDKAINEQFCSRYVAQAYEKAGFNLLSKPNYCSPNRIKRSNLLKEVDNAMKELSEDEIRIFSENSKMVNRMQQLTETVLYGVKDLTNQYIPDFGMLNEFLIENQEFDLGVAEIYINSGYLDFWKIEKIENPENFDYDLLAKILPDISERKKYAQMNIDVINDGLKRFEANKQFFAGITEKFGLKTFQLQLELYENLCNMSYEKLELFERITSE